MRERFLPCLGLVASISLGAASCDRAAEKPTQRVRVAAAIPGARDEPVVAEAPVVDLSVAGFEPARVAVPIGATSRRPIMVAVHGLGDTPEPHCDLWKSIVVDRAFVLCPRGEKGGVGHTYASAPNLGAEIDAGLAAIHARWPAHADDGPVLYAGFSLGANYGITLIAKDPARYPRAILIEATPGRWTSQLAKAYADGGGKRVLMACGQLGCVMDAKRTGDLFDERVQSRFTRAKNPDGTDVGHTSHGPVGEDLRRELAWVTEGDPRWSVSAR